MKSGRIAVLGIAVVAAIGAGIMVVNLASRAPEKEVIQAAAPQVDLEQVLVAASDIPVGQSINPTMLKWQDWPKDGIAPGYITKSSQPNGLEEIGKNSIVRSALFQGEPIRAGKLVQSDRGYMSAILPAGQRAVATNISTETSAGGFILPNDHVDVIMTRRKQDAGSTDVGFVTETILDNVRVLAIDQTVEEKNGESVVVGQTATLQLSPDQAKILVVAQQMSDKLTLSLRSLEDSKAGSTTGANYLLSGSRGDGRVKMIKYGVSRELLVGRENKGMTATGIPETNVPGTSIPGTSNDTTSGTDAREAQ